jgi:diadenosine tetraphosphate (Ap4A) HIT family hydrolase
MTFQLHPRLKVDSIFILDWSLSNIRLVNDARFPWLLLVPQRADVCEWHDLAAADQSLLATEIGVASDALSKLTNATKINVGALGNIVPQLHLHVIARFADDPAWPGPVWGFGDGAPYESPELESLRDNLRASLSERR